jgi:hypothetical protein
MYGALLEYRLSVTTRPNSSKWNFKHPTGSVTRKTLITKTSRASSNHAAVTLTK